MTKFEFEKREPENVIQQTIVNEAQKINRLIIQQDLKIDDSIRKRLEKSVLDAKEKSNTLIEDSDILRVALEILYQEQGALPENLEKEYIKLVAKEVTKAVITGQEPHQVLGQKVVELRKKGIKINGKEVEKNMEEIKEAEGNAL